MRLARIDDLDYFIQAGREFCEHSPFAFNEPDYARNVLRILDDPIHIVIVEPGLAHCAAQLAPSLYDSSQIIGRVFSTWGTGGLKCFSGVERECQRRGAVFLIADAWLTPRIAKFYRRRGMREADRVFLKEL